MPAGAVRRSSVPRPELLLHSLTMKDLNGKVALVTGAAAGFGRAIVDLLLGRGCKVALLDMDCVTGKQTVAEFRAKYGKESCIFLRCDVTDDQELDDCFCKTRAHFCGLDIVINNAGVEGEAKWKKLFAINIEAVFCGILLGFKYMGKDNGQKGGHIINVASVAGLGVMEAIPAYNTSKTAVVAMTRAFGSDLYLNRHGVKVNCICPDPMNTPLWWGISSFCKTKEECKAGALEYDKRVMPVEDAAKGIVKILEDDKNGSALLALHGEELKYFNFPN
uniref:15-hydroxyprostaglandin dehydrogenase [NAD(+)] n=1 Tax=Amblyomma parvum TaxID=251391 RepID=A0A023FV38_AMBPA